ncbi:MAG: 2-polyprenylphenol 6-hydroxylase [Rhodospirillales bacterium]|jgi:ubiquinone biosynthesis protein|nr:2-polyprenylphenol 6-hydroxylase [Rhodospirillales bacterium]MBT7665012.1 2-polyprenylphenol 6-hydroxylase [Rhodospirillaceae bacterium]MBT4040119.1 2-polyprenylphenol 6-hydroxylase [Rhodospirillales bacterium]MBT4625451.1 2-polyprenylphenol 6-hydroxylase [Rhodospirillales bacterium]MBT5352089.1 2-polyprenylphenol 6-hydroxylase [Rhodospirillales bacterium]
MAGNFRNALRLLRVARILARHDALFLLDRLDVAPGIRWAARVGSRRRSKGRPGERLSRALQEAGPSFIKFGQALSTRSDLLGEELCRDLSLLQDNLPPFSIDQVRAAIVDEFGQTPEELFASFDEKAHAAASIAQVHFAVTKEGREVAVKILRPGIEDAFHNDIEMFSWVAQMVERRAPGYRRLKPQESVAVLEQTIHMEMDLRFEAAGAAEIGENFSGDGTFNIPSVDWSLSGQRVMTTERLEGIPLDDREAIIAAGHDPLNVLQKAADAFFNQLFRDGFFHADLHPGNLFVLGDGTVGAVDFGIMGRLSMPDRRYLGGILLGFLTRDYARVAELHMEAGWIPGHKSVEDFTQACRAIAEPILDKPQSEVSIARLLGLLFQVAKTFDMETQPQLLLLQKTMLVAEGTARSLAPEANIWFMARPLIEAWMVQHLGPEARLRDIVTTGLETLERLPRVIRNLEKGAEMVASGQLKLDPETIAALKGNPSPLVSPVWLWSAIAGLAVLVAYLL